MQFSPPLVGATLIRRYKRFLADVRLDEGEEITVHCPNTGSLLGCRDAGARVWLSRSSNARRKYAFTWELVEISPGVIVGINTGRSNALVREAIDAGVIAELAGYDVVRAEVPYGDEGSRVDFLLGRGDETCYLEVKNVTAAVEAGRALFPDAVSTRGTRHLRELARVAGMPGRRAVLCFCVQRADVEEVRPADAIDPAYGRALRAAIEAGVEVLAYRARPSPKGVALSDAVPVVCP